MPKKKKSKTAKESRVVHAEEVTPSVEKFKKNGGFWSQVKLFFVTILIVTSVAGAVYVYLWYSNILALQSEAQSVLNRKEELEISLKDFDIVKSKVHEQLNTCRALISQGSGDFSQFEYCKRYLEWSNGLPSSIGK